MKKFATLYLQQNLARRHEPSACLNRILDELAPFSFLSRNREFLVEKERTTAFPEIIGYLYRFMDVNGALPRILPVACVQEPNLANGRPTGFTGKLVMCEEDARAALITLPNLHIA